MKRVLVTGANGNVAAMLLPGLVGRYELVLADRTPGPGNGGAPEASAEISAGREAPEVLVGDLADPLVADRAARGVDAIVHLAANPGPDEPWDRLRAPNTDAVVNLLESGAPRVVLASSAHAMGQYATRREAAGVPDSADGTDSADVPDSAGGTDEGGGIGGIGGTAGIDPDLPVAPCCPYGATKAFAEAYGRMGAYRDNRTVVALRLGATTPTPPATSALDGWLGPEDLRQLVTRALEADLGHLPAPFAVCHGVSANARSPWSLRNDLGYAPVLDAEAYAGQVPVDDSWGLCRPSG